MSKIVKVQGGASITPRLVSVIVDKWKSEYLPRLENLQKSFEVKNHILDLPQKEKDKPDNRLAHGLAKYITLMSNGYYAGKQVEYKTLEDRYKEALGLVLKDNNNQDVFFETSKQCSIRGICTNIFYLDEKKNIRFKKFDASEVIPVYSSSVDEFLEFAIRVYTEKDLVTGDTLHFAEVYTDREIITYGADGKDYVELVRLPHQWGDVPVVVYWNNEEQKGDFEDVISLIDAYDKAQSNTANDFDYFTDAYLALIGAGEGLQGDENEDGTVSVKDMKDNRILLLDVGGDAKWLIKNIDDSALENYKKRLYHDIFFLSLVPALTDESFSGDLRVIAVKYKLLGLEQLAIMKENKARAAESKKIQLITHMLNLKKNTNFDSNTVELEFKRNIIEDIDAEIMQTKTLEGVTSKETQLSRLSFVSDTKEEMKRMLAEMQEAMGAEIVGQDTLANFEGTINEE